MWFHCCCIPTQRKTPLLYKTSKHVGSLIWKVYVVHSRKEYLHSVNRKHYKQAFFQWVYLCVFSLSSVLLQLRCWTPCQPWPTWAGRLTLMRGWVYAVQHTHSLKQKSSSLYVAAGTKSINLITTSGLCWHVSFSGDKQGLRASSSTGVCVLESTGFLSTAC